MIKEAMEYWKEQIQTPIFEDEDGREFFTSNNHPVPVPTFEPLGINTLSGVVDWFSSKDYVEGAMIHVETERQVSVITPPDSLWKDRGTHLLAHHSASEFNFNQFMEAETFIINVQCHFEESPEKKSIIDFASKVDGSEIKTSEDSGIAQTVTVKDAHVVDADGASATLELSWTPSKAGKHVVEIRTADSSERAFTPAKRKFHY